jgi:hypothetical protein
LDPYLIPYIYKFIKYLHIRAKTIKLLEDGKNPHDIGFGYDFLDVATKTQVAKEK